MKSKTALLLLALGTAATVAVFTTQAAPGGVPQHGGPHGGPLSPLMTALDVNQDGEIDAAELANAVAALTTLDKNGDGKLSADELRPARGDHGPGAQNGGANGAANAAGTNGGNTIQGGTSGQRPGGGRPPGGGPRNSR